MSKKPHAVLVPFPSQGHINPFLKLAKLLHHKGFYITFVNNEYNHKRLIKSKGSNYLQNLTDFDFQTIPDGLPDSADIDVTQNIPALCRSMREFSSNPFRKLLEKINDSSKSSPVVVPPVSCVITDGVMSFTLKAAKKLEIPYVMFWTFGACGFMSLKLCADLKEKGIAPFKGLVSNPLWYPVVRELMEGEEGNTMKKRAMEWKRKAEEAVVNPGGSGFLNLERMVDEVLLHKTT